MKAVFWLGIMFLMQISCLRLKQSRISLLISHIYIVGCFVNFGGIFRYIWREIVFLTGLVKLMAIGNFEDLLLFQTVAQQPGVPLCSRAIVWWCSITLFFPFNLSLNLPKFHLNSRLPPP